METLIQAQPGMDMNGDERVESKASPAMNCINDTKHEGALQRTRPATAGGAERSTGLSDLAANSREEQQQKTVYIISRQVQYIIVETVSPWNYSDNKMQTCE